MAAKPEAAPAPAPAPAPADHGKGPSKIASLLPVILVIVLAPIVSWAVAQFVILPQFDKKINDFMDKDAANASAAGDGGASAAGHGGEEKGGHGGKKGEAAGATNSYEFANIVVNLAGTMGTRYLKTAFKVTGKDPSLRDSFNKKKDEMLDITINVLSSLTLADLDEPGSRNIIREKLVNAYNQGLGKKVCDQVYFQEFVVQ